MTEPISVAEAQAHLRVESDDPYYSSLPRYITAARMTVEQYLNATIVNRSRSLVLDAFPAASGYITLPDGPVTGITSIVYVDTDGVTQTLGGSPTHIRDRDRIMPAYGTTWPSTRAQLGAVTITYAAGMMAGSPLTLEDEDIKAGVLLILGDLWQNRESQIIGVSAVVNPTVDRLLHFHRRNLGT